MIYYHQIYYSWRIWYLDLSFLGICFFESWILDFEILINLWLFDIKKFRRVPFWNKTIMVRYNKCDITLSCVLHVSYLEQSFFLSDSPFFSSIFESHFPKNSQYLINGESDKKSARNKRDVEFNFLNAMCYQI